jgi:hypothetical protein
MPNVTQYQPVAWWWTRRQIGRDLRQRYHVLKNLPPKLLTLIRKLDAIEGKCLLRYAPPLERRSVSESESDWLPPKFVWQNDADLFAS